MCVHWCRVRHNTSAPRVLAHVRAHLFNPGIDEGMQRGNALPVSVSVFRGTRVHVHHPKRCWGGEQLEEGILPLFFAPFFCLHVYLICSDWPRNAIHARPTLPRHQKSMTLVVTSVNAEEEMDGWIACILRSPHPSFVSTIVLMSAHSSCHHSAGARHNISNGRNVGAMWAQCGRDVGAMHSDSTPDRQFRSIQQQVQPLPNHGITPHNHCSWHCDTKPYSTVHDNNMHTTRGDAIMPVTPHHPCMPFLLPQSA